MVLWCKNPVVGVGNGMREFTVFLILCWQFGMTSVNSSPQKWPLLSILPTSVKLIAQWGKGDACIAKNRQQRWGSPWPSAEHQSVRQVGALWLLVLVLFAYTPLGIPCPVPKSGFREHWTWCLLKGRRSFSHLPLTGMQVESDPMNSGLGKPGRKDWHGVCLAGPLGLCYDGQLHPWPWRTRGELVVCIVQKQPGKDSVPRKGKKKKRKGIPPQKMLDITPQENSLTICFKN